MGAWREIGRLNHETGNTYPRHGALVSSMAASDSITGVVNAVRNCPLNALRELFLELLRDYAVADGVGLICGLAGHVGGGDGTLVRGLAVKTGEG